MAQQGRRAWLDAVRGLALLGVLLNHLVENFGRGPWFSNPGRDWPDLSQRLASFYPHETPFPLSLLQFAGWLGDAAPGVFILLSGLGLAWSARGGRPAYPDFLRRRLLRLFPEYVAAHFLILGLALLIPSTTLTFGDHLTLLSVLGLRFRESVFFHISPAWWFVWTILQLYLVFPLLMILRERAGPWGFAASTLGLTVLSRGLGLLGWIPTDSLYFWMTGLFAGTRLAEFAAGMLLAEWVGRRDANAPLPWPRAVTLAIPIYALGLICSIFWVGTLVSNLLVSVGLTGVLYAWWHGLLARIGLLRKLVLLLGAESYGIYLLHQPPLRWLRPFFDDPVPHLVAALVVLAACVPATILMRRGVEVLEGWWRRPDLAARWRMLGLLATAGGAVALVFVEPRIWSPFKSRVLAFLLAAVAATLAAVHLRDKRAGGVESALRGAVLAASLLTLFVMPERLGPWTLLISLLTVALAQLVARLPLAGVRRPWRAATVAVATVGLLLAAGEVALRRWAPRGAGRWGEYPVLDEHPTRIYGLEPNRTTRLRYGSYDYVVRTNSFGLASPEIAAARPEPDTFRVLVIGDAFSMPEGVEGERAYPALLEGRIRDCIAPRSVQVINGGVTGYGPVEEVVQLAELAPLFRPDVVVYEFFVNEFTETLLTPEQRLGQIGFIHRGRSGPLGRLMYTELRSHANFLYTSIGERIRGEPPQWRVRHSLLEYYAREPNEIYSTESLASVSAALGQMRRTAEEVGARLIVFFVPAAVAVSTPGQIEYLPPGEDLDPARWDFGAPLRHLQSVAEPLGLPVVDLTPALRSHPQQPVYFPKEWHWNEEGHEVAASAVIGALQDAEVVTCAPR
jgi:peptidoglycan/LPS O-acetylase OafA/YrhL